VSATLVLEQALNGLQFGLMLFLIAAGLTLVLGIMDTINLAHGSLYMAGAFIAAAAAQAGASFWVALALAALGTAAIGAVLEVALLRRLYRRDHLSQVLATFAVILIANEVVRMIFGPQPLPLAPPAALSGSVELLPGMPYPALRLAIIVAGLAVALSLYWLIARTRVGMLVRAGASNREMALALGADVGRIFTAVFALGAALAALAGAFLGTLLAVQVGMGEQILIPAFVVVVIGGLGSIRGALVGAIVVGMVDTGGRAFLPLALRAFLPNDIADALGPTLASMSIYLLMAAVLVWRPSGLFPARA